MVSVYAPLARTAAAAALLVLAGILGPARAGEDAPAEPARNHELQLGVHMTAPWNLEDPFLNLAKTMRNGWSAYRQDELVLDAAALRAGGFLNEQGLPRRLPDDATRFFSSGVLSRAHAFPDYYAGHYTMEWEGDAYGFLRRQPRNLQSRDGRNRVRFFVRYTDASPRGPGFSMVRGEGVTALRIFRDDHRELLDAGEIWNPDFLDYVKRYDVIRTMDMQATNGSPIRSFDDVARPDDASYGSRFQAEWPPAPRYGAPFEILFDLADKSGAKLWLNIPAMIGAPMHPGHPSLRRDDRPKQVDAGKVAAMARAHGREILASEEWRRFAREFVDRLVASGYPADRPLYLELGNEIWNSAAGFIVHTKYADGIAKSVNPEWNIRQGYGVLSARWASALEAELAARNLDYAIVYVLASQTAWPARTTNAIEGFKHQLKAESADAERILQRTGIALATYVRCSAAYGQNVLGASEGDDLREAWEAAIDADREGLKKKLRDYCVDGPASEAITLAWILQNWRAHRRIAERHGLSIIGAYEGGSHDHPKDLLNRSEKFRSWWREYHWGPYGADVVRQVNRSLIEAFPGVILSNYASMGEIGGAPWIDGHYTEETDMLRMWDEFAKPK